MTEEFAAASKRNEIRRDYRYFLSIPTRWMDNDIYGHVNNVVYYSYFDTVIGQYLVAEGGLDYNNGIVIGVCVESMCQYRQELAFPDVVEAGLRVARLGNSSVRYEIGLFKQGLDDAVATGYFVHVFVDRISRRPTPIPGSMRNALASLVI